VTRSYSLAAIGGDGVGPEVTAEALKVIRAAGARFGFGVQVTDYTLGGERYRRTGEVLPESVFTELDGHDAILLGAVGSPQVPPGVLEQGLLLRLRFGFDQYVNLRPVKLHPGVVSPVAGLTPDRCDLVVVRENTEGVYAGAGGVVYAGTAHEVATQDSLNTRYGVERVVRDAFARARARGQARGDSGRLTLCHKTNVLSWAGHLWQRTVDSVGAEYPEVETDYVHVDAACLHLVTAPERFDVVVTDNLFGDIVTDLGAAIQGGPGVAASGNLNPTGEHPSMFEPVHGSAPDIAGNGWANPVAAVLSAALCLNHLGETEAAEGVEHAVQQLIPTMGAMSGPEMGYSTEALGDRLAEAVADGHAMSDGTAPQRASESGASESGAAR
jgi:3-isopropylmalate dehydrogenase